MPVAVSAIPAQHVLPTDSSHSIPNSKCASNIQGRKATSKLASVAAAQRQKKSPAQKSRDGIAEAIKNLHTALETSRAQGAPDLKEWEAANQEAVQLQGTLEELNSLLADTENFDAQAYAAKVEFFYERYEALSEHLQNIRDISGFERITCLDKLEKIQQIQQSFWPQALAKIICLLLFTKTLTSCFPFLEKIAADARKAEQDLTQPPSEQNQTFWLLDETLDILSKDFENWTVIASLKKENEALRKNMREVEANLQPSRTSSLPVDPARFEEWVAELVAKGVSEHQRQADQKLSQQLEALRTNLHAVEQRLNTLGETEEVTPQQLEAITQELKACKGLIENEAGALAQTESLRKTYQELDRKMTQLGAQSSRVKAELNQRVSVQEKALQEAKEEGEKEGRHSKEKIAELQEELEKSREQQQVNAQLKQKEIDDIKQQLKLLSAKEIEREQELIVATKAGQQKVVTAERELKALEMLTADVSEKIKHLGAELTGQNAQLTQLKAQQRADAQRGQEEVDDLKAQLQRLAAEKAEQEQALNIARQAAQQQVATVEGRAQALEAANAEAIEQIGKLRAELERLEAEQQSFDQRAQQEVAKINLQLEQLAQEKIELAKEGSAVEAAVTAIKEELDTHKKDKAEAEKHINLLKTETKLLQGKLKQLSDKQASGTDTLENIELPNLNKRLQLLEHEKNDVVQKLKIAELGIAATGQKLEELEGVQAKVNEKIKQADHTREEQSGELGQLKAQQQADAQRGQKEVDDLKAQLQHLAAEKAEQEQALNIARQAAQQQAAAVEGRAQALEAASAEAIEQIGKHSTKLEQLAAEQQFFDQRVQDEVAKINLQLAQLEQEKIELTQESAALEQAARAIEAELEIHKKDQAEIEEQIGFVEQGAQLLEEELAGLSMQQDSLSHVLSEIETLDERLRLLEQEKAGVTLRLDDTAQRIAAAEEKLKEFEKDKVKKNPAIEALSEKIEEQSTAFWQLKAQQQADIQRMQESISVLNDHREFLLEKNAELEQKLITAMQTAQQQVAEVEQQTRALEQASTKAREQIELQNKKLEQLEAQKQVIDQRVEEQERIELAQKGTVIEIEQTVSTVKAEAEKRSQLLEEEIKLLREALKQLGEKQITVREEIEMLNLNERLKLLEQAKIKVEQELRVVEQSSTAAQKLKIGRLDNAIADGNSNLIRLEGQQQAYAQHMQGKREYINNQLALLEKAKSEAAQEQSITDAQKLKIGRLDITIAARKADLVSLEGQQQTYIQLMQEKREYINKQLELLELEKLSIAGSVDQQRVIAIEQGLRALEGFKAGANDQIERLSKQIEEQSTKLGQVEKRQQAATQRMQKEIDDIDAQPKPLVQEQTEREQALIAEVQVVKAEASEQIERLSKRIDEHSTTLEYLKAQLQTGVRDTQQESDGFNLLLRHPQEENSALEQGLSVVKRAGETKVDEKQAKRLEEQIKQLKAELDDVKIDHELFKDRNALTLFNGAYAQSDNEDGVQADSTSKGKAPKHDSAISLWSDSNIFARQGPFSPTLSSIEQEKFPSALLIPGLLSIERLLTVFQYDPEKSAELREQEELQMSLDAEVGMCSAVEESLLEAKQETEKAAKAINTQLQLLQAEEITEEEIQELKSKSNRLEETLNKLQLDTLNQQADSKSIQEEIDSINERLEQLEVAHKQSKEIFREAFHSRSNSNSEELDQLFKACQEDLQRLVELTEEEAQKPTVAATSLSSVPEQLVGHGAEDARVGKLIQKIEADEKEAQQIVKQIKEELKALQSDRVSTDTRIEFFGKEIDFFDEEIMFLRRNLVPLRAQQAVEDQIKNFSEELKQLKAYKVEQSEQIRSLVETCQDLSEKVSKAAIQPKVKAVLKDGLEESEEVLKNWGKGDSKKTLRSPESIRLIKGSSAADEMWTKEAPADETPLMGRIRHQRSMSSFYGGSVNPELEELSATVFGFMEELDKNRELINGQAAEFSEFSTRLETIENYLQALLESKVENPASHPQSDEQQVDEIKRQIIGIKKQVRELSESNKESAELQQQLSEKLHRFGASSDKTRERLKEINLSNDTRLAEVTATVIADQEKTKGALQRVSADLKNQSVEFQKNLDEFRRDETAVLDSHKQTIAKLLSIFEQRLNSYTESLQKQDGLIEHRLGSYEEDNKKLKALFSDFLKAIGWKVVDGQTLAAIS